MCERSWCNEQASEFDHQIPVALGGGDDPENNVHLCAACHREKTNADVKVIAKADAMGGRSGQYKRRTAAKVKGKHRPILSRGFQTNRTGPFKKRLGGRIERREQKT
jgi:hypothetical protein